MAWPREALNPTEHCEVDGNDLPTKGGPKHRGLNHPVKASTRERVNHSSTDVNS